MFETVHIASITGMACSLAISIGMPIAAFIFWRRRSRAKWSSMLIGAASFVLFALILEQLLHSVMLNIAGTFLTDNIWLYALYGGACAGLFEETGRFLAMKFCMKRTLDKKNAVMYGIGHGGIEAILIVGLSMVSNLITSIMINNGLLEASLQVLDETVRADVINQLSPLWTTQPYLFYLGGMERVSAFFLHIALSYFVYKAVKNQKMRYYFLAVLLHFLVDAGTVLMASVLPAIVLEILLMGAIAALWAFVYRAYAAEK